MKLTQHPCHHLKEQSTSIPFVSTSRSEEQICWILIAGWIHAIGDGNESSKYSIRSWRINQLHLSPYWHACDATARAHHKNNAGHYYAPARRMAGPAVWHVETAEAFHARIPVWKLNAWIQMIYLKWDMTTEIFLTIYFPIYFPISFQSRRIFYNCSPGKNGKDLRFRAVRECVRVCFTLYLGNRSIDNCEISNDAFLNKLFPERNMSKKWQILTFIVVLRFNGKSVPK